MEETVAVVTEVHTPKLLSKVLRNKKAAAVATLVVAAGISVAAVKFLQSSVDVDVVTDAVDA